MNEVFCMARIDEKTLDALRERGLHISSPVAAFGDGVYVCKPTVTPGNKVTRPVGQYIAIDDAVPCPEIDAPMLRLLLENGKWTVDAHDSAGGTGGGDFVNEWNSAEDAIADICDFYFGDPARMAKKDR